MTTPSLLILLLLVLFPACDSRTDETTSLHADPDTGTGLARSDSSSIFSSFDWGAFLNAWEAYISDPGPSTGAALSAMVPEWSEVEDFWDTWDRPRESVLMERAIDTAFYGIWKVAEQIEGGDTSAVRLAARLRRISTGHMSEELDVVIGRAIIQMPEAFLRSLAEERVPSYGGILRNLGHEYVDRPEASVQALRQRRRALLTVERPELSVLRDSLISMIDSEIRSTKNLSAP